MTFVWIFLVLNGSDSVLASDVLTFLSVWNDNLLGTRCPTNHP